ncbi:NAD-dependent epimerase/dehydratase family protein [Elongatibacter sediminis]|uniref:NAD-dependent epimerase/dehydratase family protein n=1 Tax=Elongatibacter sediminis TaxID=3119006 RepID=A0AAW9RDB9_9GAMM
MTLNRRQLIRNLGTGALGALVPFGLTARTRPNEEPLRILFLGGTGFIGPHMVRQALSRGHEVTLFNRGNHPDAFPQLEQLVGDRDGGLTALEGRQWDAVIDTSGYVPRHVDDSSRLLAAAGTPHYLFISTVAVYERFDSPEMDESAPLATLEDPGVEEVTGTTYGPLKVLCEAAVKAHYPAAHTILRPTFICGPGDHTDRFIWYIDRPLAGGRMAVPGPQSLAISYVDVRDLAEFTVRALEERIEGAYNMVNPPGATTTGDLMRESLTASGADPDLVWMTSGFLRDHELEWRFPMCPDPLENPAVGHFSQAAARERGFSNRPFTETVRATFDWWMNQPEERRKNRRDVLPRDVEQSWLAALDATT